MNLMIVEDEIRLRTSLANNIAWEEHGIEVIGLAGRGYEALEMYRLKKPDIVLLDIHIPEMDGITLSREILAIDAMVKIIILSGHDNFSFAQSALEIGVMKYLLKPAGDTEILESVLDAAGQLRRQMDQLHNQAALQQKWRQQLPHLQNNFFRNWTSGKYTEWEIKKYSSELHIRLSADDQYAAVVLDMDPLPDDEMRFGCDDGPLLQFTLHSIVEEILEQENNVWVFTAPEGFTVLIFSSPQSEDAQYMMLHVNVTVAKLLSKVKECLKLTASAGICGDTCRLTQLHLTYAQAIRALQSRVIYGHNIAIPYREQKRSMAELSILPNLEKRFEIAVETGDEPQAGELLLQLWEHGLDKAETIDDVQEQVLYFSSMLTKVILQQGWRLKEVLGADFDYLYNHHQLATKEQIYSWLQRAVKQIMAHVQYQRQAVSNQIVKQILQMIEKELDTELTLHTVADRLFVNSSYLSRLFKQETGKTFSAYVLEHKMERAKQLLQQGAKVYDAAYGVGYRDVSYFTKVFRKYWGVTPGEVKQ
ncbi:response regulator [Paenibacillus sp. IITD108]|uniref:response regulator n=1 Tax=Paenibacillus sp. IITD108 TaxID=3116649 RepID=UPI002F4192B7